jgi:hypothetical protein
MQLERQNYLSDRADNHLNDDDTLSEDSTQAAVKNVDINVSAFQINDTDKDFHEEINN